jgi:replicative DNA helicase
VSPYALVAPPPLGNGATSVYRETHREIFRAMVALTDHNQPVDAITLVSHVSSVTSKLRQQQRASACGRKKPVAALACIPPSRWRDPEWCLD